MTKTKPKTQEVEFEEVTIKLPKQIVEFLCSALGFTKEYQETPIQEALGRIIVNEVKNMLDNNDLRESFAGFDGASLIKAYNLQPAFERVFSIIPIEQVTESEDKQDRPTNPICKLP